MAYTILATWDFQTSVAETGRTSRIGSYTLTEAGTPTWSSSGVDCSASASNKLTLTLPAELKVSPVWIIAGLRIMDATTPPEFTNIVGLQKTNVSDLYDGSLMIARKPSNTSLRVAESGAFATIDSGTTITTGSDHTVAARRTGVSNPAFGVKVNNASFVSSLNTSAPVDYSATSRLVFGSPTTANSRCRYHWFIMGSGAITDAEVDAMLASPSTYIYPSGPTPTPAFGRYGVRSPSR